MIKHTHEYSFKSNDDTVSYFVQITTSGDCTEQTWTASNGTSGKNGDKVTFTNNTLTSDTVTIIYTSDDDETQQVQLTLRKYNEGCPYALSIGHPSQTTATTSAITTYNVSTLNLGAYEFIEGTINLADSNTVTATTNLEGYLQLVSSLHPSVGINRYNYRILKETEENTNLTLTISNDCNRSVTYPLTILGTQDKPHEFKIRLNVSFKEYTDKDWRSAAQSVGMIVKNPNDSSKEYFTLACNNFTQKEGGYYYAETTYDNADEIIYIDSSNIGKKVAITIGGAFAYKKPDGTLVSAKATLSGYPTIGSYSERTEIVVGQPINIINNYLQYYIDIEASDTKMANTMSLDDNEM